MIAHTSSALAAPSSDSDFRIASWSFEQLYDTVTEVTYFPTVQNSREKCSSRFLPGFATAVL